MHRGCKSACVLLVSLTATLIGCRAENNGELSSRHIRELFGDRETYDNVVTAQDIQISITKPIDIDFDSAGTAYDISDGPTTLTKDLQTKIISVIRRDNSYGWKSGKSCGRFPAW